MKGRIQNEYRVNKKGSVKIMNRIRCKKEKVRGYERTVNKYSNKNRNGKRTILSFGADIVFEVMLMILRK